MQETFAQKITNAYDWWKKWLRLPIAYVALVAAVVLQAAKFEHAVLPALLALGLVLLPLLTEIHSALTAGQKKSVFPKFTDARSSIDQAVTECTGRRGIRKIRCLGVVLYYQGGLLDEILGRLIDESQKQLVIEVVILDKTWEKLATLHKVWPDQVIVAEKRLQSFLQQHAQRLTELQWSVRIYSYQHVPHWYGMLFGEDTLFLGTTFWEGKELSAGKNSVELFKTADGSHSSEVIREFIGWFENSKQREITHLLTGNEPEVAIIKKS